MAVIYKVTNKGDLEKLVNNGDFKITLLPKMWLASLTMLVMVAKNKAYLVTIWAGWDSFISLSQTLEYILHRMRALSGDLDSLQRSRNTGKMQHNCCAEEKKL